MKTSTSQSIFQVVLALNLFGLSVQFRLPGPSGATGNGKRSQPRSGLYNPEGIDRRIRIPVMAAIGNGKRSRDQSTVFNPDPINKRWLYEHLNELNNALDDQSSPLQEPSDTFTELSDWNVQKRPGTSLFPQSEEDGNMGEASETGVNGHYSMRDVLKGLGVLTDDDDDDLQLDDMAPYDRPSVYHGEPSEFRNNPLVKALVLNLKRRERLLALLANRLANTDFDEE